MLTLTKEELKSHQEPKACYICGKRILNKLSQSINYQKSEDQVNKGKYRGAAHNICNLKFNVPNEIPVVFHNASNYDYHLIIRELANTFQGQFKCLVENTKNCKRFSIPTEKEVTKIDKDGNESVVLYP